MWDVRTISAADEVIQINWFSQQLTGQMPVQ